MILDERRSAALLFDDALAAGTVVPEALFTSEVVHDAVRSLATPSPPVRLFQHVQVKRGRLGYLEHALAPMVRARRALLGDGAAGPPRFLVRMDEFPHAQAADAPDRYGGEMSERFHAILSAAGVPYLAAVLPRVPYDYLDPAGERWRELDTHELAHLQRLRRDPDVDVGVHGLDHRARSTTPRKRSELDGLKPKAVAERLDTAAAILRAQGLGTDVFVPPFNRLDPRQWAIFAQRYTIVTGGPESVSAMGFHGTPLWRGGTVHLPAYAPLYGPAAQIAPAVEQLIEREPGVWIPIVLHSGWEAGDGWRGLEALAPLLAGTARRWSEFKESIRMSERVGRQA